MNVCFKQHLCCGYEPLCLLGVVHSFGEKVWQPTLVLLPKKSLGQSIGSPGVRLYWSDLAWLHSLFSSLTSLIKWAVTTGPWNLLYKAISSSRLKVSWYPLCGLSILGLYLASSCWMCARHTVRPDKLKCPRLEWRRVYCKSHKVGSSCSEDLNSDGFGGRDFYKQNLWGGLFW